MPREQPLNQILQSVEGPVAKIIAVIIIIVTGYRSRSAIRQAASTG
jgi:type IV secretory pathway VirB2 component (pilin)